MSLMVPSAGGLEMLRRTIFGRGGTITAATNASPSVLTFATPATPPPAGSLIIVSGATGNTAINTTAIVYNISGATASIATVAASTGVTTPVNGNGVFGGTCVWSLASIENCAIKLTTTNHTPAESDTAGTWTEVVNGSGYTTGGQTLTSQYATTAWAAPATVGSGGTGGWAGTGGGSFSASTNVPESTYVQLTWNWTGTVSNVYGYYVVGAVSTTIWWEEQWSGGAKNFSNLDTLNLTPRFGLTHS